MTIWFEMMEDPPAYSIDADWDIEIPPLPPRDEKYQWKTLEKTVTIRIRKPDKGWFSMEDLEPAAWETMKQLYDECSKGVDDPGFIYFPSMDVLDKFKEQVKAERQRLQQCVTWSGLTDETKIYKDPCGGVCMVNPDGSAFSYTDPIFYKKPRTATEVAINERYNSRQREELSKILNISKCDRCGKPKQSRAGYPTITCVCPPKPPGAVSFRGAELLFDDSVPEDTIFMINPKIAERLDPKYPIKWMLKEEE